MKKNFYIIVLISFFWGALAYPADLIQPRGLLTFGGKAFTIGLEFQVHLEFVNDNYLGLYAGLGGFGAFEFNGGILYMNNSLYPVTTSIYSGYTFVKTPTEHFGYWGLYPAIGVYLLTNESILTGDVFSIETGLNLIFDYDVRQRLKHILNSEYISPFFSIGAS